MLGVAFSGGGVRSAAQLGIMQALHEQGIFPKVYAGTSGGSIVATLLSLGYSAKTALTIYKSTSDIQDLAVSHILKSILTKNRIQGMYKGDRLEKALESAFNFASLRTAVGYRLGIVATDINNGKQVIFVNGSWKAINPSCLNDDNVRIVSTDASDISLSSVVRASCSMPGIFIPKKVGDMLLVDGGLTNNLPSDLAKAMGATQVISIDLGYAGQAEAVDGVVQIVKQSIDIMMERGVDANSKDYGIYLNPQIFDVKVLDTHRIDECFERGYYYAYENMEIITSQLKEN